MGFFQPGTKWPKGSPLDSLPVLPTMRPTVPGLASRALQCSSASEECFLGCLLTVLLAQVEIQSRCSHPRRWLLLSRKGVCRDGIHLSRVPGFYCSRELGPVDPYILSHYLTVHGFKYHPWILILDLTCCVVFPLCMPSNVCIWKFV